MPTTKPPAIIIGLDCITGLQTARLLADRGVPVVGIACRPDHFACRTRVCRQKLFTDTAGEALIETLLRLGPTLEAPGVLYPCTDMSVWQISLHRDELRPWYRFALPDHDVVELLMDKVRFYAFAQEAGLPVPRAFLLHSRREAEQAARELRFPCMLKPPVKTPRWEQNTRAKVFKVHSPEEFLAQYDRCAAWSDVLIVQEWVEGPDSNLYSCNVYFDAHAQPLVAFVSQKLRQWPPESGTGCLGMACRNDVLLETTLRLFRLVRYHGLGYLEMKQDVRTGEQLIIEPNVGRPTGRSAIAEAGGVELHYTMYCDLAGLPLPPNRQQRYEDQVKWIYLRRDLQTAWHEWRRGRLTVGDWWRSLRGRKRFAVLSLRDPLPFLAEIVQVGKALVTGRHQASQMSAPSAREASRLADPIPSKRR